MEEPARSLSEQLHEAVKASGLSLYRIAKDSGLSYAIVHRFMSNGRGITLETAERLIQGLNLTVALDGWEEELPQQEDDREDGGCGNPD